MSNLRLLPSRPLEEYTNWDTLAGVILYECYDDYGNMFYSVVHHRPGYPRPTEYNFKTDLNGAREFFAAIRKNI